jgi:succinate dehydrogenase / fumarate reductase, iron-sulfur subunit
MDRRLPRRKTCPKGLNPAQAIGEIKKLMVERR